MMSFYADPTDEPSRNSSIISVCQGKERDSLEGVDCNQNVSVYEKAGTYNGSDIPKWTCTYDIAEGCNFFSFECYEWCYVQEILFF